MRTVLLLTAVLLFACAAAAQNGSAAQDSPAVPQLRVQNNGDLQSGQFHAWRVQPDDRTADDNIFVRPGNFCLKIRSYIFERQDGNAPRLVGMTTCTPANRFQGKRALKSPGWGVYPATAAPAAPAIEVKR